MPASAHPFTDTPNPPPGPQPVPNSTTPAAAQSNFFSDHYWCHPVENPNPIPPKLDPSVLPGKQVNGVKFIGHHGADIHDF